MTCPNFFEAYAIMSLAKFSWKVPFMSWYWQLAEAKWQQIDFLKLLDYNVFHIIYTLFSPEPWYRYGWKNTISPAFISKWILGADSGGISLIPQYALLTPSFQSG